MTQSVSTSGFAALNAGRAMDYQKVPRHAMGTFQQLLAAAMVRGWRTVSLFAMADPARPETERTMPRTVLAVLADDSTALLHIVRSQIEDFYPSMAADFPQVQLFEREMAEQCGIPIQGHPWLKPVRFASGLYPQSGRSATPTPCGLMDFYQVGGSEVHEVAVGPVHAGVIEPGHFRFQCHGEEIFNLEISLGYQHRGVERALIGGPDKRSLQYAQTLCGDSTIGHTTAWCQILEALSHTQKSARAQGLRAIALELERLANHVGDLGAISGDVGFLPTASHCGRLRGEYLNMTAMLCSNRFGRDLLCPGGVQFDVDMDLIQRLENRLGVSGEQTRQAVELLWNSPSVMSRLEETGTLEQQTAIDLGLVGPMARACGLPRDARQDHPTGQFRFSHIPTATWNSGDVFARAFVRWLEVQRSSEFIAEQLRNLPTGDIRSPVGALHPNCIAVSMVEGWRGEICHTACTDSAGRLARYKVVDPSFHNWPAVGLALRGEDISDFPLCNKSFNLSYCGHDL